MWCSALEQIRRQPCCNTRKRGRINAPNVWLCCVEQSRPKIPERLFHSLLDLPHNRNLKSENDRNCVQGTSNTLNRSKQTINEQEKQQDSQRKSTPRLNRRPLGHRDMLAECCGLSCSLVEPLDHEVHRDSWHLLEDVTWAGSKLTTVQSRAFRKRITNTKGVDPSYHPTQGAHLESAKKTTLEQAKKFTHPLQGRS